MPEGWACITLPMQDHQSVACCRFLFSRTCFINVSGIFVCHHGILLAKFSGICNVTPTMSRICTTILGSQHNIVRPQLGGVPMLHCGEIPLRWNFGDNTKMTAVEHNQAFVFFIGWVCTAAIRSGDSRGGGRLWPCNMSSQKDQSIYWAEETHILLWLIRCLDKWHDGSLA